MLHQGIMRPSNSLRPSPICTVPKKADASGKKKWRIVVDYNKLNENTIDDRYPLPLPSPEHWKNWDYLCISPPQI